MLHIVTQDGVLLAYPRPSLFVVKPNEVEVWGVEDGEPKLLEAHTSPQWRNDCIHEEPACECVEQELARRLPPKAEDVMEKVRRKLLGGV